MNDGLKASAILIAALMLAASGVHSASRAWGTNAGAGYEGVKSVGKAMGMGNARVNIGRL